MEHEPELRCRIAYSNDYGHVRTSGNFGAEWKRAANYAALSSD